jgi:hypothetical protein
MSTGNSYRTYSQHSPVLFVHGSLSSSLARLSSSKSATWSQPSETNTGNTRSGCPGCSRGSGPASRRACCGSAAPPQETLHRTYPQVGPELNGVSL